jgi:PAS domain S-box-containing protein
MENLAAEQLFAGDSEMARLMRAHDWSQTPLGRVETWPQSLRSTLSICLNSRFPIAIYWGADHLLLYNDAWRPIVGDKHPWALGNPAREVWSEIWDDIGLELADVLATGEGTFHKDDLLSMYRFGYTEECFFEYTFNPIQGQKGIVEGVFNVVTETTYRVLSERRAQLLRELAAKTGIAKTAEESCGLMIEALRSDPLDIPFALLYLIDPEAKYAHLCGSTAFAPDNPISPTSIDLIEKDDTDDWSIARAVQTAQPQVITDLPTRFGVLPGSPWPESPQSAMVLPITATSQGKVTGVLVAVASPRRRLDEQYRDFFTQVAGQVALAIANARVYEEERKRAEALAEIDRAKTVFFSNVSHEFRTPLTLMLSPLEELSISARERLQSDEREQLQLIQRNGLRLQKLVNTLLDFSRIEAGRVQASYEPTDLATYTAELASTFRSLIERAKMKLEIDCPPLSQPVYVDREMWEKIVFNLLSNAFKFTFTGSITVELRAVGDAVKLSVRDTGVGIAEAELPRLFERFHRVSGTKARTYEGSGIGLSLVQELVKLHTGAIEVGSVEGEGTCFTVSIPTGTNHLPQDRIGTPRTLTSTALSANAYLEEALRWLPETNEGEVPILREAEQSSASLRHIFPSVKILVVDDNADMRDYVLRLLSQQYEVEAVSDGLAALAAVREGASPGSNPGACVARQQMPDLILTDVMMPNLDGFGLVKALRTDPQTREIPIILLSARAGEESRIEGLEVGADDYLIKPFSARELLARVEATLKLAQLRKEAGAAIRESEEKYRTLFESIDEGFCVIEMIFDDAERPTDYRFLIANPAFDKQTGKSNAVGKTVREIAPQHENYWFEIYGNVVLTGESVRFENYAREFKRWYEVHAFRVGELELKRVGVLFNDISDRKQAELMLNEHNHLLEMIASGQPLDECLSSVCASISKLKPNTRACFLLTDADCQTFPRSITPNLPPSFRAGLKDAPINDLCIGTCGEAVYRGQPISCADIANDERWSQDWRELCIAHGISACYSQPVMDRNNLALGSLMLCFSEARTPTDWEYQLAAFGTQVASIAFERDRYILALRESEAKLRLFIEQAPASVAMFDPQMCYLTVSQRWVDEYHLESMEATIGRAHYDLFPNLPDRWRQVHQRCLAGAIEKCDEDWFILPDGSEQWLRWEINPWYDSTGAVGGILIFTENITERKIAEAEREQLLSREQAARETAEQANRIKDEFLAVLSHELRSPLNPILGWSKLLQQGKLDATKTQIGLAVIERNVQLQAQLIDDLLDISRILRGKLSLNQTPVDLRMVISSALETVRLAASAKSLQIQTVLPSDVGTVMGDAGRLQQIVWNLLSNAVKFTNQGGQITVALTQIGTHAQIQVMDTGKGINPDFLPYVFEHFRQEDGATTRKFGGLGLGLAIARQIVEMHGGQIGADSSGEGQGTTFTVKLPLAPTLNQLPSTKSSDASINDLNGICILVVDDEPDSRDFITLVLELSGASVISVASGIEALTAIEQSIPDLIISDIGMPEMDGYMLLQQVRTLKQVRQVSAIALTAYAGEFDRQQALQAGFQKHLSKPIKPNQLIQEISDLIGG